MATSLKNGFRTLTSKGTVFFYLTVVLLITSLALALVAFGLPSDKTSAPAKGDLVAVVNGEPITKDDFINKMMERGAEAELENMITERLIMQEATKAGVTIRDEDVDLEMDEIKSQFKTDLEFTMALSYSNLTEEDLREQVRLNLMVEGLLKDDISVTEESLLAYFEEHKAEFSQEEEVRASHILLNSMEEAEEVKGLLDEGQDFATLAQEKSADEGTAPVGGDLGFFRRGVMAKEFEEVAFSLSPGEVSDVVETTFGYHIIRVDEVREAADPNFEESRDTIYDILFGEALNEKAQEWLAGLKAKARIENYLSK